MSTAMSTDDVFYSLPAHALRQGMSTADGQDILDVHVNPTGPADAQVVASVYTPSEDEAEDNDRQCAPESRLYGHDDMVDLAVFHDTEVDGSTHPLAVIRHLPTDGRLDYCRCGVSWPCPDAEPAPATND